jgi:negative regulator of sigma E activity
MSSFSEQDPLDPDDPELDYTPLRLRERATKLGLSVSQAARSEPTRWSPISRPASLDPKAINEPARRRDLDRRAALFSVAARVAAVAGVVAVVALLFVIMKPASRQPVAGSTPSDVTGSTSTAPPQSSQEEVGSKPTLAEFKALLASPPSQPATHEQSQQLLQNFLQWRTKSNTTETSQ